MSICKIRIIMTSKETEREYNKKYYASNKDKILNQMKQKIFCDSCGKCVNKYHLNRHKNTKSCQSQKNKDDIEIATLKKKLDEIKQSIAKLELAE